MKVVSEHQPSRLVFYSGIVLGSVLMPIISLYMFGHYSTKLIFELTAHTPSIELSKGAFYLLGCCIGILAVSYDAIYLRMKKKHISDKVAKILGRVLIASVILTFGLPQLVHFSVSQYLTSEGYEVCHEASRRWLHSVTIVYTIPGECEQLIASK